MQISLPKLPEPGPGEKGPYCVIAIHYAMPDRADAYEQRMMADLEMTRAEPGESQNRLTVAFSSGEVYVNRQSTVENGNSG